MFNKFIGIGNLTGDPEIRYLPNGTGLTQFNIAINSRYGGDEKKNEVLYLPVKIFGKQSEACSKYLAKGSQALVEGRIKQESWESNGEKKSKMVIIANDVKFLSRKKESDPSEDQIAAEEYSGGEGSSLDPF